MSLKISMTASNVGVWERYRSLNPAFKLAETIFFFPLSFIFSSIFFLTYSRLCFRKYYSCFFQEERSLVIVPVCTYWLLIQRRIRVFMYMYPAMTNCFTPILYLKKKKKGTALLTGDKLPAASRCELLQLLQLLMPQKPRLAASRRGGPASVIQLHNNLQACTLQV